MPSDKPRGPSPSNHSSRRPSGPPKKPGHRPNANAAGRAGKKHPPRPFKPGGKSGPRRRDEDGPTQPSDPPRPPRPPRPTSGRRPTPPADAADGPRRPPRSGGKPFKKNKRPGPSGPRARDDGPRAGGKTPGGKPPRDGRGPRSGRPGPRRSGPPSDRPGGRQRFGPGAKSPRFEVDEPRHRVHLALAAQADRFPDLSIDALDDRGLDDRDAAFAHALYDTVVARWPLLVYVVAPYLTKPWPEATPNMRAALLAGAAQLLFMDSVPARAAVSESVRWMKGYGGISGGSAVNAILRRVAELIEGPAAAAAAEKPPPRRPRPGEYNPTPEIAPPAPEVEMAGTKRPEWTDRRDEFPLADGSALALSRNCLPRDPMERLAVSTGVSIHLLRSVGRSRPLHEVRRIARHALAHPPVILNTAHARAPLPDHLVPHDLPGHHVWTGPRGALGPALEGRVDIWVQDPGSSLAVQAAAGLTPGVIYDVCAGMGTKTRQLAAAFPEARIVATDVDRARHRALSRAFGGSDRVTVIEHRELREHAGRADLVLLDVPCSNTGVLARRIEARHRFDAERLESLVSTQRQIIADAIPLLRTGPAGGAGPAHLLYSTCSLDARENQEQAQWAIRWHGFNIRHERQREPSGGPGEPPERYSDGSYAVLMS